MKKKTKQFKKAILSLGAFSLASTLILVPVACSSSENSNKTQPNNSNKEQSSQLKKKYDHLFYNRVDLWHFLENDITDLSSKAKKSDVYRNWILSTSVEHMKDSEYIRKSIWKLDLEFKLKMFLVQNYLEKYGSYAKKPKDYNE